MRQKSTPGSNMKHGWFRHRHAIFIVSILFLQLHCKKSSDDSPPPPTPPKQTSDSACASGLAALTFEATPTLPAVDPRTLKTQNAGLQLADTGNGTYTKFQLSCDTDPNAEVIRWKACAVSSSAGCYPKDQEWSVMFECGDLPSLKELQGQVVRFTVQSCVPQHRDQVRIQNHQPVDANELSCESPGQEFIFKLPSNFSDYNTQYASVMDELYGLNQKYMDIGKQIYAVSQQPADAAASAPATGLGLADGTTDSSLNGAAHRKVKEAIPQWAKSFRNAGPYMLGALSASHDAVISEVPQDMQDLQDASTTNTSNSATALSLASTDPSTPLCSGAISGLTNSATDTGTQITPPPISTPPPVSAPKGTVTDTAWGPSTCQTDQEWNGASNTCVNRCPTGQTWNDAQGTCESPTTDTSTGSKSNKGKAAGLIVGGTLAMALGLVIVWRDSFPDGMRRWRNRTTIKKKLELLDFIKGKGSAQGLNWEKIPEADTILKGQGNSELKENEVREKIIKKYDATINDSKTAFDKVKTELLESKILSKDGHDYIKEKITTESTEKTLTDNQRGKLAKQVEARTTYKAEGINPEGNVKFERTGLGSAFRYLGIGLVIAGLVMAVVGAVLNNQLAADTGGIAGYVQNLADIDQKTFDLGDQAFAQSAQLDALLAAEKAAHPGKKH